MKVLHIKDTYMEQGGGPDFALTQITDWLSSQGIDVAIATVDISHDITLHQQTKINGGITLHRFPGHMFFRWTYSMDFLRWLRKHCREFDLVHVHGLFSQPCNLACRIAYSQNVPYIVRTAGSLDPTSMKYNYWKKLPYYYLMENKYLMLAASIHATSRAEARALRDWGLKNITIIPHGIRSTFVAPKKKESHDVLKLLYLSRLDPIKGLEITLHSLAILLKNNINVELWIAGSGHDNYLGKLKQLVDSLQLSAHVRWFGWANQALKFKLFRDADIFVLASYHENFGVAVVEAMEAGLPVVISDQVALAEEIQQADAGRIVPAGDASALAGAIETLLPVSARRQCGENAGALVRQRFTLDACGQAHLRLYERLVSGRLSADSVRPLRKSMTASHNGIKVILSADDFGYSGDTVKATIALLERRVLTSASIMANMPATADAIAYARYRCHAGFGIHLTFAGDASERPVSNPCNIPSLVNSSGRFLSTRVFYRRVLSGRLCYREILLEMEAQIKLLLDAGVRLVYADSHGHIHKFSIFRRALQEVLPKYGIRGVRIAQNYYFRPQYLRPTWWLGNYWSQRLRSQFITTDYFFMPTDSYLPDRWAELLISRFPKSGIIEVGFHPGLMESWRRSEYDYLLQLRDLLDKTGHLCLSWDDLMASHAAQERGRAQTNSIV